MKGLRKGKKDNKKEKKVSVSEQEDQVSNLLTTVNAAQSAISNAGRASLRHAVDVLSKEPPALFSQTSFSMANLMKAQKQRVEKVDPELELLSALQPRIPPFLATARAPSSVCCT